LFAFFLVMPISRPLGHYQVDITSDFRRFHFSAVTANPTSFGERLPAVVYAFHGKHTFGEVGENRFQVFC